MVDTKTFLRIVARGVWPLPRNDETIFPKAEKFFNSLEVPQLLKLSRSTNLVTQCAALTALGWHAYKYAQGHNMMDDSWNPHGPHPKYEHKSPEPQRSQADQINDLVAYLQQFGDEGESRRDTIRRASQWGSTQSKAGAVIDAALTAGLIEMEEKKARGVPSKVLFVAQKQRPNLGKPLSKNVLT